MKTVKILMMFLLAGSVVFNACKKKDDPKAPNIAVSADKTQAAPGEDVTYTVTIGSEENRLAKLEVNASINGSNAGVVLDTTFSNLTNTQVTYVYNVNSAQKDGDEIVLTFTVTDNQGLTSSTTQSIKVAGQSGPTDCGKKTVGSYNNATYGSFYDADGCTVYKQLEASQNQAKVDFVYYYGSTNNATLAAPSDASFGTGTGQINIGIQGWSTRNATTFKKLPSTFDYANATAESIMNAYNNAGGEASKANNLTNNEMIGFKTVGGKYGVIRVSNITGTDAGSADVEVKVQN